MTLHHEPEHPWPRLLGRKQVAAYLGISKTGFDRHVRGQLTEKKIGTRVLWDRKEVDALIIDSPEVDEDTEAAKKAALAQL
jgi:predicted DNA-binding transcriptional regulator AlpA